MTGMLLVVFLMTMLLSTARAWGEPVGQEAARQKAAAFLSGRAQARGIGGVKADELQLAVSTNEYHVFNRGQRDGFVIISGDDSMPDVLAYSDNEHFDTTDMPPALSNWLKDCDEEVKYAREHHLPKYQPAKTRGSGKSVAPMVQTKWGQRSPYNDGYPMVNGSPCLTGCVPTAMAQIINYHKHPKGYTAEIPGYISGPYGIEMETLPPTTFDWDNMALVYNNGKTTAAQNAAVNKLMRYCTTAARAQLGPTETGASNPYHTFKKYFGYGSGVRTIYSTDVISDVWKELIYHELDEGRPIYCEGVDLSKENGHAFVVDGYDENGLLSVNWGWNGTSNGFYNMIFSHPGAGLYSLGEIVIGISPVDIQTEFDDEEVVLTTSAVEASTNKFYTYGANQCNITNISAIHESRLKGTYDIDCNWAIYQNGLFVEYLYSEENTHTYHDMAYGNNFHETSLMLPNADSKYLGKLFVEPGAYKLVPVSRQHGKNKEWTENIGSDEKFLTVIVIGDGSIRVYAGEPQSTVDPAELTDLNNTFMGLRDAASAKLATVNQNALDIETIKNSRQLLDELEDIVEEHSDLDYQIRGMQFGDKKDKWKDFSDRLDALRTQIDALSSLPSADAMEYENSELQDDLKYYVKTAKGEIVMTQYIMNAQELNESKQRATSLAQKIESCDITDVTQQVSSAMQTLANIDLKELKDQVRKLTVEVNIAINGSTPGDVNGDGVVNILDIVDIVNYRTGNQPLIFIMEAVDKNGNESIDDQEVQMIINLIMTAN